MTLAWREVITEIFFLTGFIALLFTAVTSSGQELGLYLKPHPIPLPEAQQTLSLP